MIKLIKKLIKRKASTIMEDKKSQLHQFKTTSKKIPSFNNYLIGLDIDDTLIHFISPDRYNVKSIVSYILKLDFSCIKMSSVDASSSKDEYYFVFPGTMELLKYLSTKAKIALFSHGTHDRNSELAKYLNHKLNNIISKFLLLSRQHCINKNTVYNGKLYNFHKKPLDVMLNRIKAVCLKFGINKVYSKKNTIIVDNRASVMLDSEIQNLISFPFSRTTLNKIVYLQKLKDSGYKNIDHKKYNKTFCAFKIINHLFYVAGVFKLAFDKIAKSPKLSLVDAIKLVKGKNTFTKDFTFSCKSIDDLSIYKEGEKILQQFNSNIKMSYSELFSFSNTNSNLVKHNKVN